MKPLLPWEPPGDTPHSSSALTRHTVGWLVQTLVAAVEHATWYRTRSLTEGKYTASKTVESFCLKRLERSSKMPCSIEEPYREAGQDRFTQSHPPKPDPEARSSNSDRPLIPHPAALEVNTRCPSKEVKLLECLVPWSMLVWLHDQGVMAMGIKNCFGGFVSPAYSPKLLLLGRRSSLLHSAFWSCQSLLLQCPLPQDPCLGQIHLLTVPATSSLPRDSWGAPYPCLHLSN